MGHSSTTFAYQIQPVCSGYHCKSFVSLAYMDELPIDAGQAGTWTKHQREERGLSAADLANRINGLAQEAGDPTSVSQQVVSKFEQGKSKRKPSWTRFIIPALKDSDGETKEDPHLSTGYIDHSVPIKLLPTYVGLGSGGTGDDDHGTLSFSRDLVERELRAEPSALMAMVAEGNSMEPEFRGGDQILVDTRRRSLAQPGAFCLWDGDGHVVKFLEKVPGSDPPCVKVISANGALYPPQTRLVDEINLIGRVVWYGRRVQ